MATKRMSLSAEKRKIVGKKVKKLRLEGKVPANVFGKNVKSLALSIKRIEFEKLYRTAGETTLIDIHIEGEKEPRPALIAEAQFHSVSDHLLHVNFHQVDLTKKVTAGVPVRLIGESPAVKDKGAVLVTVMSEINVEALPANLPDHIAVDISGLVEFGDSVHVKDLRVDSDVKILADEGETVVTAQEPKEEAEEAPVVAAVPAEGEMAAAGAGGATGAEKKPAEAGAKPEAKKEGAKQAAAPKK